MGQRPHGQSLRGHLPWARAPPPSIPTRYDPGNIGILAISFDGDDTNATGITCNEITAATQAGIRLLDDNPADAFVPMVTANNNSITGNTAGIDNQTPVAVNAQQNWRPAT